MNPPMTKDEINRAISEKRNEWERIEMCGGSFGMCDHPIEKDWHSDANWPTLFRELPHGTLNYVPDGSMVTFLDMSSITVASSIEEAVCLAWLKWKGVKA